MTDNLLKQQAFKLKGRLYTFTVLSILSIDEQLFSEQLADVVAKAPRLFDHTPIVFDCSDINAEQFNLEKFCSLARLHGLVPVAIQGGNATLHMFAQCQGLAILNGSSTNDKSIFENILDTESSVPAPELIKTKLLVSPVRSGQQVVSKGDLIISSSVSHGAELLADGHIHVYGALRGRALAGITGDKSARIFCQSLEAELLSIAGYYRLSDAITPVNGPCQIFLQDNHIQIEPL